MEARSKDSGIRVPMSESLLGYGEPLSTDTWTKDALEKRRRRKLWTIKRNRQVVHLDSIESVVNRPRFGCDSQAHTSQLGMDQLRDPALVMPLRQQIVPPTWR